MKVLKESKIMVISASTVYLLFNVEFVVFLLMTSNNLTSLWHCLFKYSEETLLLLLIVLHFHTFQC